jgi:hypothetical protein
MIYLIQFDIRELDVRVSLCGKALNRSLSCCNTSLQITEDFFLLQAKHQRAAETFEHAPDQLLSDALDL